MATSTSSWKIASYELLSRLAERAGDQETVEIAQANLADEKGNGGQDREQLGQVIDLTLAEKEDASS